MVAPSSGRLAELGEDQILVTGSFAFRFPATGAVYEDGFVVRLRVRDGQIAECQIYEDSLALLRAYRG
ncbi:nuclear transport factor 2 family protein [Streptomyces sp. NBC_01304]|uniref:nuclear transport factor 2 family protein n=1 Tax=Streptomyces sp. NBC_01304 TaxID=2903818 RepID=UPI002E12593D|nr:hypothetical protein OG430_33940 [Streptomyces sp. NBC_01304]